MAPLAANLLIVDQHLTFEVDGEDDVEMLGTNLIQELHELGYRGVVCVHSGAREYARLVQVIIYVSLSIYIYVYVPTTSRSCTSWGIVGSSAFTLARVSTQGLCR